MGALLLIGHQDQCSCVCSSGWCMHRDRVVSDVFSLFYLCFDKKSWSYLFYHNRDKCVTIRQFPSCTLPLASTDGWLKKKQFLSHIGQSSYDWKQVYISSQSWVLTQGESSSDQLPHQLSQKSQGACNHDQQQRSLLRLHFFLQESWLLRPSSESPWQC